MSDAAVIYDFGMNNGDDVEYYLLKADRVVAVEANSALCDEAARRFASAIAEGRLTILNVALSDQETSEPVTFSLPRQPHVLSQRAPPRRNQDCRFRRGRSALSAPRIDYPRVWRAAL